MTSLFREVTDPRRRHVMRGRDTEKFALARAEDLPLRNNYAMKVINWVLRQLQRKLTGQKKENFVYRDLTLSTLQDITGGEGETWTWEDPAE